MIMAEIQNVPLLALPFEMFLAISERLHSIQDLIDLSQTCRQLRDRCQAVKDTCRLPAEFRPSWARRVLAPHPQLLFAHYATQFGELYWSTLSIELFPPGASPSVPPILNALSRHDYAWLNSYEVFYYGLQDAIGFCARNLRGMTLRDVETLRRRRDSIVTAFEQRIPDMPVCGRCPKLALHDYLTATLNYINLCCLHKALPRNKRCDLAQQYQFKDLCQQYQVRCNSYLDACMLPELHHSLFCKWPSGYDVRIIALEDLLALLEYYLMPGLSPSYYSDAKAYGKTIVRDGMTIEKLNFIVGFDNLSYRLEAPNQVKSDLAMLDQHRFFTRQRGFYAVLRAWLEEDEIKWSTDAAMRCFTFVYDYSGATRERDFDTNELYTIRIALQRVLWNRRTVRRTQALTKNMLL